MHAWIIIQNSLKPKLKAIQDYNPGFTDFNLAVKRNYNPDFSDLETDVILFSPHFKQDVIRDYNPGFADFIIHDYYM